jgi:phosphopentomutase
MKAILIILDSVGAGPSPDAADYGDAGAATLPHIAEAVGGLKLPTLQSMGLGNIPGVIPGGKQIKGVDPVPNPIAGYGAMQEVSEGKDTVTGHWEIAGLEIRPGFHVFPPDYPSFPPDLVQAFEQRTGRKVLGNKASSGTVILDQLGAEHMKTGKWIAYTSADSVFQIASHEEVVPIQELYKACEIARELCDKYKVGRVIARPFLGTPGAFKRTENRRDFAFKPEEKTIIERLTDGGVPVYAVGKIEDIFAHRGITESEHTGNNLTSQEQVAKWTREKKRGLIFTNYIDFDMLYGHRRDAQGYADSLMQTDKWLESYLPLLGSEDILIITADHGNDPTYQGSDHTRECVPLIAYQPGRNGRSLGLRLGFYDVAQTLADFFGIDAMPRGKSFL